LPLSLTPGIVPALYPSHLLAEDGGLENRMGFGGVTLAQNAGSETGVERTLDDAVRPRKVLYKRLMPE
jgi:hypothetical protein